MLAKNSELTARIEQIRVALDEKNKSGVTIVESLATDNGGRAGTRTEVSNGKAAELIAKGEAVEVQPEPQMQSEPAPEVQPDGEAK